jgi:hypothetical protein
MLTGVVLGYFILGLNLAAIVGADKITYIQNETAVQVYLSLFFITKLIQTLLLSVLFAFHLMLLAKGLSTFEYLTGDKNVKNKVHSVDNVQKRLGSEFSITALRNEQNPIEYLSDDRDQFSINIFIILIETNNPRDRNSLENQQNFEGYQTNRKSGRPIMSYF